MSSHPFLFQKKYHHQDFAGVALVRTDVFPPLPFLPLFKSESQRRAERGLEDPFLQRDRAGQAPGASCPLPHNPLCAHNQAALPGTSPPHLDVGLVLLSATCCYRSTPSLTWTHRSGRPPAPWPRAPHLAPPQTHAAQPLCSEPGPFTNQASPAASPCDDGHFSPPTGTACKRHVSSLGNAF